MEGIFIDEVARVASVRMRVFFSVSGRFSFYVAPFALFVFLG